MVNSSYLSQSMLCRSWFQKVTTLLTLHHEQKLRFWHLYVIKTTQKIWLFPNIYDNASHSLSKAQIDLKKVFYSIFVVRTKIWILKYGFLSFFGAKWLKLKSKTQKINYQWFLAHFLWFLSLFQIPDVKHEFQLVKLKVRKNGILKPPAIWDAFQMLPIVGLTVTE